MLELFLTAFTLGHDVEGSGANLFVAVSYQGMTLVMPERLRIEHGLSPLRELVRGTL